ncbi:hypothetical protein C1645_835219 [Glomus cerebriforme]|uniref:Uncharacterized protein n=1 Tax=Glomus cerebriforme TaxID=658196 RepID=A0A397SCU5_9GLOM|nr:hypothetical protein C1645_835219 [Glomus cerebriforme]
MNWKIFNIESLQLFFNNWKGRKTLQLYDHMSSWLIVIEAYEIKGIVGYKNFYYSYSSREPNLESLKDRHPMLLQIRIPKNYLG